MNPHSFSYLKEKHTCVSRFDFLSVMVFLLSREPNRMLKNSCLNLFCYGLLDNLFSYSLSGAEFLFDQCSTFCLTVRVRSGK